MHATIFQEICNRLHIFIPFKLHPHNHLFIVISGQAKVLLDKEEKIINENEAFLVKGEIPHSVWNNSQNTTVMLGISVK